MCPSLKLRRQKLLRNRAGQLKDEAGHQKRDAAVTETVVTGGPCRLDGISLFQNEALNATAMDGRRKAEAPQHHGADDVQAETDPGSVSGEKCGHRWSATASRRAASRRSESLTIA